MWNLVGSDKQKHDVGPVSPPASEGRDPVNLEGWRLGLDKKLQSRVHAYATQVYTELPVTIAIVIVLCLFLLPLLHKNLW
jgi:hypothetical protein